MVQHVFDHLLFHVLLFLKKEKRKINELFNSPTADFWNMIDVRFGTFNRHLFEQYHHLLLSACVTIPNHCFGYHFPKYLMGANKYSMYSFTSLGQNKCFPFPFLFDTYMRTLRTWQTIFNHDPSQLALISP